MPDKTLGDAPGIARYPSSTGPGFWAALGIAILIIVAYLALCLWLAYRAEKVPDDSLWSRLVYVAHGLTALVSAAVGWLFGREVHRAAAEHATQEAGAARQRAQDARGEADAGRALAKAIKALPEPGAATTGLVKDADVLGSAAAHLVVLKRLAEELFPAQADATEIAVPPPSSRPPADRGATDE